MRRQHGRTRQRRGAKGTGFRQARTVSPEKDFVAAAVGTVLKGLLAGTVAASSPASSEAVAARERTPPGPTSPSPPVTKPPPLARASMWKCDGATSGGSRVVELALAGMAAAPMSRSALHPRQQPCK